MILLQLDKVGKVFREFKSEWRRFAMWFGMPFRPQREYWVLKQISFTIVDGEAVGIIGRNGAGKSTLLKLIVGTMRANEGTIQINGRVSAILELGIGFNPDLTGRQNVMHSAGLLGITREQIHHLLPEIEDFAEIGEYFEQPTRTYSSGMLLRLAFSVATAIRPDVLIIDEALSVGDAYFSQKCISRIKKFKSDGTTLLFVSHDALAVKTLCDRAILLDNGRLVMDSSPEDVLDYYNGLIASTQSNAAIQQVKLPGRKTITRSGNKRAVITDLSLLNNEAQPAEIFEIDDDMVIRCKIDYVVKIKNSTLGFMIRDRLGNDVFGTNTFHLGCEIPEIIGELIVEFRLKLTLGVGDYSVSIASHTNFSHVEDNHDWWDQALVFQVVPSAKPFSLGVASIPADVCIIQSA